MKKSCKGENYENQHVIPDNKCGIEVYIAQILGMNQYHRLDALDAEFL